MSDDESAEGTRNYRDEYLSVRDGLRLHYRDYPGGAGGPSLLCLPGLTRNIRDFAEFADRYSPRFRVITLEFRGRGESEYDPLPSRYNPLTYAGDVLQLLDDLNLEQAIFVGTSLGGLVTMTIAAIAPTRIAASILNDVGPELSQAGLDRIKTYVGRDRRFASWDDAARAIADTHQHLPDSYTHADWVNMARRVCREVNGEIRFDYDMAIAQPFDNAGAAPQFDMWPLFLALAQKPLLVLRGEKSDLLSAPTAKKMKLAAPAAAFTVVRGVGHAPTLDEPDAVAAIDSFLNSLVSRLPRRRAL